MAFLIVSAFLLPLLWVFIWAWGILPLDRVFHYFAFGEPRYETYRRAFRRLGLIPTGWLGGVLRWIERRAWWPLPLGVLMLVFAALQGPASDIEPKPLLLLPPFGLLIWWAASHWTAGAADDLAGATANPRDLTTTVAPCPSCGTPIRRALDRSGEMRCPRCRQTFHASTKPRRTPALLIGLAVVGLWVVAIRPWSSGETGLPTLTGWSGGAFFVCLMAPGVLNARSVHARGRRFETSVLRELGLAFAIMTAVSLVFWWLNASNLDDASGWTVREILKVQRGLVWVKATAKSWKVSVWLAVATILPAAVLLRGGYLTAFDRLLAGRKVFAKALKIIGLVAICAGSFSLSGTAATQSVAASALARTFAFDAKAKAGAEKVARYVQHQLAVAAAQAALDAAPSASGLRLPDPSHCEGGRNASDCAGGLDAVLRSEADRANNLAALWPEHRTADGIPAASPWAPDSRDVTAAVKALDDMTAAKPGARAPTLSPLDLRPADVEAAVAALDASGAIAPPAAGAFAAANAGEDPSKGKDRLTKLIELGVDTILDLLPFDRILPAPKVAGRVAENLFEGLTGAVRAPFDDVVREVTVKAIEGCRQGLGGCRSEIDQRIAEARSDPRVRAVGASMPAALQPVLSGWTDAYWRARAADDRTREALLRYASGPRASEGAGEWSGLRRRWSDRLKAPSSAPSPRSAKGRVNRLLEDWDNRADELALKAFDSKASAPPDGWDHAFLAYLDANPTEAAAFAYMILNDPAEREAMQRRWSQRDLNILGSSQGDFAMLDYDDIFLLFASAVRQKPFYPAESADQMATDTAEFQHADLPKTARGREKAAEAAAAARAAAEKAAEARRVREQERARAEPHVP